MVASSFRRSSAFDSLLAEADRALQVLSGTLAGARPMPGGPATVAAADAAADADQALTPAERRHAAGLMRVDHVGEICAQALYRGQALTCSEPATRALFADAAAEEVDHLVWLEQRLRELRSRTSLLNPLWYAGAFALGALAGKAGEAWNLGFMAETEKQVERHLEGHLASLPAADVRSLTIVEQMREDERQHRLRAERAGARPLPAPVRGAMRAASRVMTGTAYYI
ncbi:2-polyprenyl-3-methyl-6-methoxy-1,4-benzoquinone monooxygenase [Pigmentiphaga soli]|uniref:3-demethoxyubiquinol 3-hydroxylase n=1 Tax=Pigmentiphaga soli TaxID=1007095 RepID=A0ABP8GTM2_9BURK